MLYGGRPPADVSASALFRLLLAVPYAERPIDYRLRGAEDVSLSVRALRSCDEADLLEEADVLEADRRANALLAGYVRLALIADGERAFRDERDMGALTTEEVRALGRQVVAALVRISPSYLRSDLESWMARLREGAAAPNNAPAREMLGSATPERYFGRPLCELTDGQMMAANAAYGIVNEHNQQQKQQQEQIRTRRRGKAA